MQFSLCSSVFFMANFFVLERYLNDHSNQTLDGSLVDSQMHENGMTHSMENICSEPLTVHSQSDQSDVTTLEKNEEVKLEVTGIVPENNGDHCELPIEDIKHNITTMLHDHHENNETKSLDCNSLMYVEVKNVFSLCENNVTSQVCHSICNHLLGISYSCNDTQ